LGREPSAGSSPRRDIEQRGKTIMRSLLLTIACVLVVVGLGLAVPAAEQRQASNSDQWRYVKHQGVWWYWLPEGRWIYWQHDRWNDFSPSANCMPAAASASADSGGGRNAGGFIVSGFERATEESLNGSLRSVIAPPAVYGPRPRYQQSVSDSDIGPVYGHGISSVTYPPISARTVGPFYGKAGSSVEYPSISRGREIGPFYGKADSSAGVEVDRSRFPDY
jgi:hypothetical protein